MQVEASNRERWVRPVAIFCLVTYLTLEALITKRVTNAIFTETAAITVMDALSKPWLCTSTTFRAADVPAALPSARRVGKEEAVAEDDAAAQGVPGK